MTDTRPKSRFGYWDWVGTFKISIGTWSKKTPLQESKTLGIVDAIFNPLCTSLSNGHILSASLTVRLKSGRIGNAWNFDFPYFPVVYIVSHAFNWTQIFLDIFQEKQTESHLKPTTAVV